jgi:DNA polymerase-3 subunit delta'
VPAEPKQPSAAASAPLPAGGFDHVLAQQPAVDTLVRALRSGRVHHAYRFEGPEGVGKELTAFALARALVCKGGDPLGCGRCDACVRALTPSREPPHTPSHPDVMLVERGLYATETLGRTRGEVAEISVDQVRKIVLAHAGFPPHEGRAKVFLIRRAEELSTGAANALLKTLEEPRAGTHFVLLTSRGNRLLDTIRSRTLPVRFGPLPDAVVRGILGANGVPSDRHDLAVELAAGSASTALELCDAERTAAREEFVAGVLSAVRARDLGAAVAMAEQRARDKEQLKADLRALAAALARQARADVRAAPAAATTAARRYEATLRAIGELERNASPVLALVTLVSRMREA